MDASARLVNSRDERPRNHRVSTPNDSADGNDGVDRLACLGADDTLDLADFSILGEDGVADARLGNVSGLGPACTRTHRYGVSRTGAGCFKKMHVRILQRLRGEGSPR